MIDVSNSSPVLVYGTMGEIGSHVKSSLEHHGVSVELVDFPQNVFRDEFGYRRGLVKAIAKYSPRIIIPVGHQLALSLMRAEIPSEIKTFVETPDKIRLLDSKLQSSDVAARLGIPQPEIWHSVEEALASACIDLIFKRDKSFGGSGVYRPRTPDALINLANHEAGGFLIERLICGKDISVDAIRKGNYFVASVYESKQKFQGQGPSSDRQVVDCPQAVEYARIILDAIDYNGICGMDFKMDAEGKLYFLECNPRFTGGIATQIEAGFDIPWLFLNAMLSR